MTGKISDDADRIVDGTEKVAAAAGGANFGILISSILTYITAHITSGVSSVAGLAGAITAAALKTALTLVKGDVGLGNVDNTSDVNKPVSTAQATAIALKVGVTHPQGRLTLQTLTPVIATTQSAKTTVYYTPYNGNIVPVYDGSNLIPTTFAELSIATTDATKNPAAIGASKINDWFVWNDVGTVRLSHGPDWTNDTTRSAGTALAMVNGILLNSISITNGPAASRGTYVGTTRSNGSSQLDWILGAGASGGSAAFFGVWNYYNRVSVSTTVGDTGVGYTYTTATVRQARASAGNQISFVAGLVEDGFPVTMAGQANTVAVGGATALWGVGLNSTSTFAAGRTFGQAATANVTVFGSPACANLMPQLGLNVISANESGDGANANTFDNNSLNNLSATLRL